MLLKIVTNCHKTKIITGIQDAEVWDKIFSNDPMFTLSDIMEYASNLGKLDKNLPPRFPDGTPVSYGVATYDEFPPCTIGEDSALIYEVRVVDYLKDGQWHRVAIADHAYLCNDEGRTIQKIG